MFRLVRTAGLLSLMAGGFTSCLSEPSYSTTPSISFNSISRQRYTTANGAIVDSVFITINFQDGDGDLGLSSTEATVAPYTPTYYGANFYMTPFVKNATGTYTALRFARPELFLTVNSYYDRFDHPSATTDNRAAPLRGTLRRAYEFLYGSPFLPNQEVKFTVSIFDRALHQSNEIETTSIVFPK